MGKLQRWIAAQVRVGGRRKGGRFTMPVAVLAVPVLLVGLLCWPFGCASHPQQATGPSATRIVRVRILQNVDLATLVASQAPVYYTTADNTQRVLNLKSGLEFPMTLNGTTWRIGATDVGNGAMTIIPVAPEGFAVNGHHYRGSFQFVPVGTGKFDVVNHVDLDDYLKGVLRAELLPGWEEEAYKAQAIVARTYALYEKASSGAERRHWDLHPDQRSQVYNGYDWETAKSRVAVDDTAGMVVAYGPPGDEHIFKAYFSSCCGGVTQSAVDAFGPREAYIDPLMEQSVGTLCNAANKYTWGPVVVTKVNLAKRFRAYGMKRDVAQKDIGSQITRIEVQQRNQFGRPTHFLVMDNKDHRYSMMPEEFRAACNAEAPEGQILFSSFVNVINDQDTIHFVDGHGYGHGVGMCQWCAEARAKAGLRHEDIVLAAFPHAKLVRAY